MYTIQLHKPHHYMIVHVLRIRLQVHDKQRSILSGTNKQSTQNVQLRLTDYN